VPPHRADDELREEEWPDSADLDPDEAEPTVACPECGSEIHEEAPRCPHCGIWVTGDSSAAARSRGWLWPCVVGALVVLALLGWRILW
jgi:uncharacterized paraquat-inducible protein A